MKIILKILAAPIVVALALLIWLCSAFLYCSAFVFGLAGTLVSILSLLVLLSGSVQNALILAVIAILVSPMGLPMAAAWMVGKVQVLRYAIQERVYR